MNFFAIILVFALNSASARETGSHNSKNEERAGQLWDAGGRRVDPSLAVGSTSLGRFKSQCGTLGDQPLKYQNYSLVQRWALPVANSDNLPEPSEEGAKDAECVMLLVGKDRKIIAEVVPLGKDGEEGQRLTVISGEIIGKRKGMNYMLLPGGYIVPAPCYAQGDEPHLVVKTLKAPDTKPAEKIMSSTEVEDKSNRGSKGEKDLPKSEQDVNLSEM